MRALLWLLLAVACTAPTETTQTVHASSLVVSSQAQRYIVTLARGDPQSIAQAHGVTPRRLFSRALNGFSAELSDDAAQRLRQHPAVSGVYPVHIVTTRAVASWGLDRIDQRDLPLSGTYTAPNGGAGVTVYVLDTGVLAHTELVGRVGSGWDFIENDRDASDCRGHGTHVAGTVAGSTVGVARQATIISVRMLDCNGSGTTEQAVAAVDWVLANGRRPAVINASWGTNVIDPALDQAVASATAAGIVWANAAGNSGIDACTHSPGRSPTALNVGASNIADERASFSDWGSCVDLFAPGEAVTSLNFLGGLTSKNGTSMASPHGAGVSALYLAANPLAAPATVVGALVANATLNRLTDVMGSSNRLLSTSGIGAGVLAPLPPPVYPVQPVPSFIAPVHVTAMTAATQSAKGYWWAGATVSVRDGQGKPVYIYSVELDFNGYTGTCNLDFTGSCTAWYAAKNNQRRVTATVRRVNPVALYVPAANLVSSVVITKP